MTRANDLIALAGAARRLVRSALQRREILHDEYLDWLLLCVAGMQDRGNLALFDIAISEAPEAPMLEIGSFCGLSTSIIQYLKRKHGRHTALFTCDPWEFEGAEKPLPPAAAVSRGDLRRYVMDAFERSVRSFNDEDLPFSVQASSDDFFSKWHTREQVRDVFGNAPTLGGPLGFCFIDGDHSEACALRDFLSCDRHLVPGGLILFDDSADASGWEVTKVIRRVKRTGRYEVVAKNPNYLFRKLC